MELWCSSVTVCVLTQLHSWLLLAFTIALPHGALGLQQVNTRGAFIPAKEQFAAVSGRFVEICNIPSLVLSRRLRGLEQQASGSSASTTTLLALYAVVWLLVASASYSCEPRRPLAELSQTSDPCYHPTRYTAEVAACLHCSSLTRRKQWQHTTLFTEKHSVSLPIFYQLAPIFLLLNLFFFLLMWQINLASKVYLWVSWFPSKLHLWLDVASGYGLGSCSGYQQSGPFPAPSSPVLLARTFKHIRALTSACCCCVPGKRWLKVLGREASGPLVVLDPGTIALMHVHQSLSNDVRNFVW